MRAAGLRAKVVRGYRAKAGSRARFAQHPNRVDGARRPTRHGVKQGASIRGPDDSARAESFFHSLKAELTRGVVFLTARSPATSRLTT
jgi:hypothetical protein